MGRCMVHLSPAVTVLDVVLTLCRTLKEVERKNTDCQHFFFKKITLAQYSPPSKDASVMG